MQEKNNRVVGLGDFGLHKGDRIIVPCLKSGDLEYARILEELRIYGMTGILCSVDEQPPYIEIIWDVTSDELQ